MKLLEGKVAIVTGSGQGIGRCIALCLAENGAKVITNNRKRGSSINAFENTSLAFNEEEKRELQKVCGDAQSTADVIVTFGGEAIPFFGDVSDAETAREMINLAIKTWGRVDIIVNNASSNSMGNILDLDIEHWNKNIASKLNGAFYLMHYALPYMKAQGYGRILNAASDAFVGIPNYAAYGAGNAGLVALTKSSAYDLAGTGITVNAYTPLACTRSWYNAKTNYRLIGIPNEVVEANSPVAMKRTAEGMVPFLAYLASEECADISGKLFKLSSDGIIGLWSESKVVKDIVQEDGVWTIEGLRYRLKKELL